MREIIDSQMSLSKSIQDKLAHLLQEEEMDLFLLTLHYRNDGDLNFFPHEDRKRVRKILDHLIQDTQKHSDLIKSMIDMEDE